MLPAGARDPRPGLSGVLPGEVVAWLTARGEPVYRARQIADHLWRGGARTAGELRTLPQPLRTAINEAFRVHTLVDTEVRVSEAGMTEKALHRLDDGRLVESVLMRYPARGRRRARATICISSQAGCAVGCPFCATGELGFMRDLDTAEIVDQVRFWQRRLVDEDQHVTNVVFMGMGEPLLNTGAVFGAAQAISDPQRFGLGARHIVISTSGVLPGMEQLIVMKPNWTLAVSLHAARPELRDVLVPLNRRYPVADVVDAAGRYAAHTGRRVTYEYVMIDGINDTPADALAAARLLSRQQAHVNLIPMNPVAHTPWRPSGADRIEVFARLLRDAGIGTTIRLNRGVEIGAACGQLAADRAGQPPPHAVARRQELLISRSREALVVGASS